MNAEEIIRELRWLSENDKRVFTAETMAEAADLIESLQAQLLQKTQQLEASKRRERAAVEDLNTLRKKSRWTCFACKYDASYVREICAGCGYNDNWEWRGVQEAGEGAKR